MHPWDSCVALVETCYFLYRILYRLGSFKGSKMVKLASNDFGRIKLFAKQSEVLKMNEKALKNEIRELLEKNRVLKDQNKNDLEYVMDQELRVEREKFYRLKFNIESMDID